jgi:hypothetical protein
VFIQVKSNAMNCLSQAKAQEKAAALLPPQQKTFAQTAFFFDPARIISMMHDFTANVMAAADLRVMTESGVLL